MKFSVQKSAIAKAIAHASRVVERRNTIPILSNVVLSAEGRSLSLRTTDLDLELSLVIEADVETSGTTTVPASLLNDIVRKLPGDQVSFIQSKEGAEMTVGAGRSKFKLQCLSAIDYPDMSIGAFSHSFTIEADKFKRILDRTQFAISTEETRYYLNGIFFHTIDNLGSLKFRGVATDGHRLARSEVDAPDGSAGMPGIIVPRKAVGEVQKLLELGKTAFVELNENKIRVSIGETVLTSKLIDGTFPDYARVIPTSVNVVAIADTKAIAQAADRVSTVSSERGRAVKLRFETNLLHLVVNNPDSGSAEDQVEIDFDADPFEIGFNARYLQDILSNIVSDKARISLIDPGSPTVIRDEAGDDSLFVLMPMRV